MPAASARLKTLHEALTALITRDPRGDDRSLVVDHLIRWGPEALTALGWAATAAASVAVGVWQSMIAFESFHRWHSESH